MNHQLLYLVLLVYSYTIPSGICGYVLWSLRHKNDDNELLELLSITEWILCLTGIGECLVVLFHHVFYPIAQPEWLLPTWLGLKVIFVMFQWYFVLYILRVRK